MAVDGRALTVAVTGEAGARQAGVDGTGGTWTAAPDVELGGLVVGTPPGAPAAVLVCWAVLAAALAGDLDMLLPIADVVTSPG